MSKIIKLFNECEMLDLEMVVGRRDGKWHIGIGKKIGNMSSCVYYRQGHNLDSLVDTANTALKKIDEAPYLGHNIRPRRDFLSALR